MPTTGSLIVPSIEKESIEKQIFICGGLKRLAAI
jgi:hypothetical protein